MTLTIELKFTEFYLLAVLDALSRDIIKPVPLLSRRQGSYYLRKAESLKRKIDRLRRAETKYSAEDICAKAEKLFHDVQNAFDETEPEAPYPTHSTQPDIMGTIQMTMGWICHLYAAVQGMQGRNPVEGREPSETSQSP